MGHEKDLFNQGELGVAVCDTRAEVILPSLDCSFGCVAPAVAMQWWNLLEGYDAFPESFFEFVGAFIVEDVECGCKSLRLEWGVQTGPGVGQSAGLASLEGFGKDYVAVVVI